MFFRVGKFVGVGVREQAFPSVEWVFVVFPALFLAEIAKRSAVHGLLSGSGEIAGGRGARRGDELTARRGADENSARSDAGHEALQVFLLFGGERLRGSSHGRRRITRSGEGRGLEVQRELNVNVVGILGADAGEGIA